MRTLALLPRSPWPADTGARQRTSQLLRALRSLGPVDLAFIEPLDPDASETVGHLTGAFAGARVWAPRTRPMHRDGRRRWLTQRRLPLSVALIDRFADGPELAEFVATSPDPYDLVWSYTARPAWQLSWALPQVPLIIDLADVQWVAHDQLLAAARRGPDAWTPARVKDRIRLRVDRDRWGRFELVQGARADLVTVCSAEDRERHGIPGSRVIPNGYERADVVTERPPPGAEPVLLLAGQLTYGPNADGARWFAEEVLPHIRRRRPGARLALVGAADHRVRDLAGLEGVEVLGRVPRMSDQLARADVVVVPLRQGSGTRIKIIEAWAHGVPVVSTRLGAEGLGATGGCELALADDPVIFADAVVRVLGDQSLRDRFVTAGRARFESTFDWEIIRASFVAEVEDVLARRAWRPSTTTHRTGGTADLDHRRPTGPSDSRDGRPVGSIESGPTGTGTP